MGSVLMIITLCLIAVVLIVFLKVSEGATDIEDNPEPRPGQIKIACVGDSITYGMMVRHWERNCWPKKLGRRLGSRYCVLNYGENSATLSDAGDRPYRYSAVYKESLAVLPDLVLIMLGTNDSKPHNWPGPERFADDLRALAREYQGLPSGPQVVLLSPVDPYPKKRQGRTITAYGIRGPVIREIRERVAAVAEGTGCRFLDLNKLMRDTEPLFNLDGIHPNAAGADKIARIIAGYLREELGLVSSGAQRNRK